MRESFVGLGIALLKVTLFGLSGCNEKSNL